MTEKEIMEVRKYHATSQYADPRVVAMADQLLALLKPWIPVGERLPSDGERVFGYFSSDRHSVKVTTVFYLSNGKWQYNGVTHWMPLPPPPLPSAPNAKGET